jgi:sulfur carrier protein
VDIGQSIILIKLTELTRIKKIRLFYQEEHMRITINGELEQLAETNLTITRLLEIKKVESPDLVSVLLNDVIVDRAHYETIKISDNDAIEFLYFMGGGAGLAPLGRGH